MTRRQICSLVVLICLLVALPFGSTQAEETLSPARQAAKDSTMKRGMGSENKLISFGEQVEGDCGARFSFVDFNYESYDGGDLMCISVLLDISQSPSTKGGMTQICDYDFILLTADAQTDSPEQLKFYLPEAIYERTNEHLHALAWPVTLTSEENCELMVDFVVPKSVLEFAIVYTNMLEDETGIPQEAGPIYSVNIKHNLADFNFQNETDMDVTKMYVAPMEAENWSEDLISLNTDGELPAGTWLFASLSNTVYQDNTDDSWSMKLEFADGEAYSFSKLDLVNVIDVALYRDKDGYHLKMTY